MRGWIVAGLALLVGCSGSAPPIQLQPNPLQLATGLGGEPQTVQFRVSNPGPTAQTVDLTPQQPWLIPGQSQLYLSGYSYQVVEASLAPCHQLGSRQASLQAGSQTLQIQQLCQPPYLEERHTLAPSIHNRLRGLVTAGQQLVGVGQVGEDLLETDLLLIGWQPNGQPAWQERLSLGRGDWGMAVSVDHQGNYLVAGYANRTSLYQSSGEMFLLKLDPQRRLQWKHQWGQGSLEAVVTDPQGDVYAAGYTSQTPTGQTDLVLYQFDSTGQLLWSQQLGTAEAEGDLSSIGLALDWGPEPALYLSSFTHGSWQGSLVGGADGVLLKFDLAGHLQWLHQSQASGDDRCGAIVLDAAGEIYQGCHDGDLLVRHYSPQGQLVSELRRADPGTERLRGLTRSSDGYLYLIGDALGSHGLHDVVLAVFSPKGRLHWSERYGQEFSDLGTQVALLDQHLYSLAETNLLPHGGGSTLTLSRYGLLPP